MHNTTIIDGNKKSEPAGTNLTEDEHPHLLQMDK
jgi:hypothetical protein